MTPEPSQHQAIIAAANRHLEPDAALKARVRQAIDARIAARARPPRSLQVGAVVVAVVAGAALAIRLLTAAPEPVTATAVTSAAPPAVASATAPVESAKAPEMKPVSPPPAVVRRAPARPVAAPAPPPASTLSEELRLVGGARTALAGSDFVEAEKLLVEHRTRFASGLLAEERDASIVDVVCHAGRTDEGRALRAAFERAWPSSVHLARVRAACIP